MRINGPIFSLTCALVLAVSFFGCTKATIIGTPCLVDKDCNVKGQVCAPGYNGGASIYTHACSSNVGANGCPVGYDCYPTDPAKGATCNKALYEVDTAGNPLLFGVDCSSSNDVCLNLGTANPSPSCRRIADTSSKPPVPVDFDPNAYCSGACSTDTDCPLDFTCAMDYDMVQKCLRRKLCSPCTYDTNCPRDTPLCVPTTDGTAHYCTKTCNSTNDCGGLTNTALTCAPTTSTGGVQTNACLHRYGACVGEGNICDPCLVNEDCAKSHSVCLLNPGTGEGFCTKRCTSDTGCSSLAGKVPAACDNTDQNYSYDICNGDVDHSMPGYLSCWLPE